MTTFGKQMAQVKELRDDLDPADFVFCNEYYCGPNDDIAAGYSHEHFPDDWDGSHADLGTCDHCGTSHYYGAIFRDRRDGSYLAVGITCAGKFFSFKSRKSYLVSKAKREAEERHRRANAKAEAEAYLASHPEVAKALEMPHYLIEDIRRKLFHWGSISEPQAELVLKIAAEEAEKEPEPEPLAIPEDLYNGRHQFSGVVLGIKAVETSFGWTTKILFQDDRGFKLWGTYPTTGKSYDKGARIQFKARLDKSKDDECFAFFSRPTSGKLLRSEDQG